MIFKINFLYVFIVIQQWMEHSKDGINEMPKREQLQFQ